MEKPIVPVDSRPFEGLSTMRADYVKHNVSMKEICRRLPRRNPAPFVGISTMREHYPSHTPRPKTPTPNKPAITSQDGRCFQGCSVMKDDYVWKDPVDPPCGSTRREPLRNPAKFEGESTSKSTYVFIPMKKQAPEVFRERRWAHPGGTALFDFKLGGCSTTQSDYGWKPASKPDPLPVHKWSKNAGRFHGESTTRTDYVQHPTPKIVPDHDRSIPVHKFEGFSTTKSTYVHHPFTKRTCLPKFTFSRNKAKFYGASVTKEDYRMPTGD